MSRPDPALATVLKRFRMQRDVTQEDLAFEANVTISTLSRIERGVTNPSWASILAVARVLKMKLDEFNAAVETEQRDTVEKANGYSQGGHSPTA